MAARRASVQFLGILQRSSVSSFRPVVVPRQAAVSTFSQGQYVNEHVARSTYGGFFGNRQLHKESQATNDNEETHQYERTKMTDEGGGSVESDYGVKAAEVSERGEKVAQEVKDKASETTEQAKGKASEVASEGSAKLNQAKDSVKEKTSEVANKASEVVDEGKEEVSKNADSAKDTFQKVSETATGLKEVGVEAGKAVKRDAAKLAQKVGLKTDED